MTRYIETPTPYGYAIFCDDIRQEASGKFLYIGVYNGALLTNSDFPVVMPSFAIAAFYLERVGESSEPVSVSIYIPGSEEPIATAPLPMEQVRQYSAPAPEEMADLDNDPRRMVSFNFMFAPFQLKCAGRITVRTVRGDSHIRLGSIQVAKVDLPRTDEKVGS